MTDLCNSLTTWKEKHSVCDLVLTLVFFFCWKNKRITIGHVQTGICKLCYCHRKCQASISTENKIPTEKNPPHPLSPPTHTQTPAYTHWGQGCSFIWQRVVGHANDGKKTTQRPDKDRHWHRSLSFAQASRLLIRTGILICLVKAEALRNCWQAQENLLGSAVVFL